MKQQLCRILYVEKPTETVGGSIISLYELVRGLDRRTYEPVVLLYGPSRYREKFEALGIQVIVLNEQAPAEPPAPAGPASRDIARTLGRYSSFLAEGYNAAKQLYLLARTDWPLARRVARIIASQDIDLVHHNTTLPGNRATVLAARLAGVPQVCHIRLLKDFSFIELYISRFVDQFIYNSTAVERLYRQRGIPAAKGQVIYNPIDTENFNNPAGLAGLRIELGLGEQDRLVSNVGRLDWWKGQDYFLEAMARVVEVEPRARALLVGDFNPSPRNQAYLQRLQQLVADLKLADRVIFAGFRSDIPRIMAASEVVVLSSSEPEPFGRVVVEAMMAGRPVVATAAGGVLDIIEDRLTGLLVPLKDVPLMAAAIQELLQQPQAAVTMGQRAQQSARLRFSVERHVTAVQAVYQQVLASAGVRSKPAKIKSAVVQG